MKPRLDYAKASPGAMRALFGVSKFIAQSGLEPGLLHMMFLRVSQINGCAFCIDMHWKDAVAGGEDPQRLYMLPAWREWDGYTARERAAFAWAEAVTLVTEGHVPDAVYASVREEFGEEELVNLTLAVTQINAWNRMNVAFRMEGGGYVPGSLAAAS